MGNRNVVIVDYGLGNLHSVNKAVALVGGNPVITGDKEIIAAAEKLILPGVGAFGDCMANLEKAGVIPVIKEYIAADKPFLGICLGMQVLFEEVYFVHSYCCRPTDRALITSVCDYGTEIVASVGRGNISGVQFHPEKSSEVGLGMLKRFVNL